MTFDESISKLQNAVTGTIITPESENYEQACKVWNGNINKHPNIILQCRTAEDVVAGIQFARENNLILAVRGGGHSLAGNSICDGGILVDLSTMKAINVDPQTQSVSVAPGVLWDEFDKATLKHGLATPGGQISTTGVAGLTLGGGIGWLSRQHGLSCDNLNYVNIVTADGRQLRASSDENADLFWGIRGGGGNFGVVTEFNFQLHPLEQIVAAVIAYPLDEARTILEHYRDFTRQAPRNVTTRVGILILPDKTPAVVLVASCSDLESGEEMLQPLGTYGAPLMAQISLMPYSTIQTMFNDTAQPGDQYYMKSDFTTDLPDEFLANVIKFSRAMTSPLSQVFISHLDGAMGDVEPGATAYAYRHAKYVIEIIGHWTDPSEESKHVSWVRQMWDAIHPFSAGGGYVNFIAEDDETSVRQAYGENYHRLVELKNKYDPENLFKLNQNIKPSHKRR